MNRFESLDAWKAAHQLTLSVYKETKAFPSDERFRLVNQLCRAVSSIPANLAEGNARNSKKEFLQFVSIARGSLEETRYHLLLAKDLGYISSEGYKRLSVQSDQVAMLLSGLHKYLKK